jgi:hypothetical protein
LLIHIKEGEEITIWIKFQITDEAHKSDQVYISKACKDMPDYGQELQEKYACILVKFGTKI